MAEMKNVRVVNEWTVIHDADSEATVACVYGQGEIWQAAGEPPADALGFVCDTPRQAYRVSGRTLAISRTGGAVFVISH